jgi:hypothetical protein
MTRKIGNIVILENEPPDKCAYCGKYAELRPYGRDHARICFDCATKPENNALTERIFGDLIR